MNFPKFKSNGNPFDNGMENDKNKYIETPHHTSCVRFRLFVCLCEWYEANQTELWFMRNANISIFLDSIRIYSGVKYLVLVDSLWMRMCLFAFLLMSVLVRYSSFFYKYGISILVVFFHSINSFGIPIKCHLFFVKLSISKRILSPFPLFRVPLSRWLNTTTITNDETKTP